MDMSSRSHRALEVEQGEMEAEKGCSESYGEQE